MLCSQLWLDVGSLEGPMVGDEVGQTGDRQPKVWVDLSVGSH